MMITTTTDSNNTMNSTNPPPQKEEESALVLCDFCNSSKALLYCRADSANLCFSCDRQVHSTNPLFHKHTRSLLCNSCNSSPSSIFCCTESSVLCQNCDWETHKRSVVVVVHDRRPLEGFNGCPSVSELLSFLGFEDLSNKKSLVLEENEDDGLGFLVWDTTPAVVSLDELIVVPTTTTAADDDCCAFQAMGVPPLPKNRNASCGKHKAEVLSQLREMAKMEPNFSGSLEDIETHIGFQSDLSGKFELKESSPGYGEPASLPSYETNAVKWEDYIYGGGVPDECFSSTIYGSFVEMNHIVPDKDSDVGDISGIANGAHEVQSCNSIDVKTSQVLPKAWTRELNCQERDSAITRYKEKRKTRRYDKHIRYESRKVRAESRTRIKGRFAKMDR